MKKATSKSMVGGKSASRSMLSKKSSLSHDLPAGFEPKQAAGKKATMPAKAKSIPNVAKAPRMGGKAASRGVTGMKSHAAKPKK